MADIIRVDFRKRDIYRWTPAGFVVERLKLHNQTWHHHCKVHGLIGMPRGQQCRACGMFEGAISHEPGGAA